RYQLQTIKEDDLTIIQTTFYPSDEHLYVMNPVKNEKLPVTKQTEEQMVGKINGPYTYELSEENVCVLDMATYRIAGQAWQLEKEILKVDREVRKYLNMPYRSGDMIQPWYREKYLTEEKSETYPLQLNF